MMKYRLPGDEFETADGATGPLSAVRMMVAEALTEWCWGWEDLEEFQLETKSPDGTVQVHTIRLQVETETLVSP